MSCPTPSLRGNQASDCTSCMKWSLEDNLEPFSHISVFLRSICNCSRILDLQDRRGDNWPQARVLFTIAVAPFSPHFYNEYISWRMAQDHIQMKTNNYGLFHQLSVCSKLLQGHTLFQNKWGQSWSINDSASASKGLQIYSLKPFIKYRRMDHKFKGKASPLPTPSPT